MKNTRLVALVALVVVCIAGWAILGLNTMNDVKTQQNTVEAAQYYRGKKLFQLSLQNYQSAIAAKPTQALYDEYLAACAEYYEDCPTRNVRNTEESAYAAAVAAYPKRADYWEKYAAIYYEDGDYDTVVDVLKSADAAKVSFNVTMPARPLLQIMNRWHRLAWMACIWAGMARKTFFSAVRTATFWIRATHSLARSGRTRRCCAAAMKARAMFSSSARA